MGSSTAPGQAVGRRKGIKCSKKKGKGWFLVKIRLGQSQFSLYTFFSSFSRGQAGFFYEVSRCGGPSPPPGRRLGVGQVRSFFFKIGLHFHRLPCFRWRCCGGWGMCFVFTGRLTRSRGKGSFSKKGSQSSITTTMKH